MMTSAHLFAGGGGGLLADLILGHRPIYAIDHDRACCALLARRRDWFPDLRVECADATTADYRRWAGRVGVLHAGVPCPKWSSARRGRGAAFDGWDAVVRAVRIIRPRFVFLECVAAFVREHQRVTDDLASLGYRIDAPLVLDAAAVGAPHPRRRYWSLGYADDESQPVRAVDAEVAGMPAADGGLWWSADPRGVRMDDGLADRMDRWRMIGNGQVPLQAAAAWIALGGPLDAAVVGETAGEGERSCPK